MKRPIYLDFQATTPTDMRVLEAMLPYFSTHFGNPHSSQHFYGWEAEAAVEIAREEIAATIDANPEEIIFTSGATESNNLAIHGLAMHIKNRDENRRHIITVSTEHRCVLESCRALESEGFSVTYLPVNTDGLISAEQILSAITPQSFLISAMAANNEIGVIQPLEEIGEICKKHNIFFHCDAAQAFGKIPLSVAKMNIDLLSISAHKIYGPKGIGALYIRNQPHPVRLKPLLLGGGQELGLRSGTIATPLVVGLGKAAKIARETMRDENLHLQKLHRLCLENLRKSIPDITLNGHATKRIPGNLNICFPGISGDKLMLELKTVALSSGSACSSAAHEPSYVLEALGLTKSQRRASLRLGIGRTTTEEEINQACEAIISAYYRLPKKTLDD